MRIMECSDSFLPVVDGVGRVVVHYCEGLSELGHEVYAVCPMNDAGFRGRLPYEIVDFFAVTLPSAPQYKAGVAELDPHFRKRADLIRPDLIHVHSPGTAGWEGVHLAHRLNVPLIGTFHSKFYDDMYQRTHSRMFATVGAAAVADFFELCDETWTVSRNAAEELRSYGYRGEIRIVPNGTDVRFAEPAEQSETERFLGIGDEPLFLYVGQIDRKKNIDLSLEACALLAEKGYAFRFAVVGQGRDRKRFEAKAAELGIADRVIFTGHVSDLSMLAGIYQRALLFLFGSLYDTAGLVVSEAAAMGTASVVLENGAPAELVVNGQNGFTCADDPVSMAQVLENVLNDPGTVRQMGETARNEIPLAWHSVMENVETLYRERIAQGQKPRRKLLPIGTNRD